MDKSNGKKYKTIDEIIGKTPLVRLQRQNTGNNIVLVKLEGNNPAGSVKDRPAQTMITEAEKRGRLKPGDTIIEATSGNTGIALAMMAAIKGYEMILVMPASATKERRSLMAAYGAELVLTPADAGMEGAIDQARSLEDAGKGVILDQFSNAHNPLSHYRTTGPEIWEDTGGEVTHFVSSMGTTGTMMGTGKYLKEKNKHIVLVGAQPEEGSNIPGIRKWPKEYLPKIYDPQVPDRIENVSQLEAEDMARRLAKEEGLFCGISSGGNVAIALRLCRGLENAVIVAIICDRGDRYISSGIFPAPLAPGE